MLTQGEVDARIATWARNGNAGLIPDAKLPAGIARDTEVESSITTHNADSSAHPSLVTHGEARAIHYDDSIAAYVRIIDDSETQVSNPGDYWMLSPLEVNGSILIIRGDKSAREAIRIVVDNRNFTYAADFNFLVRNFSNRSIQEISVANGQGVGLVVGNLPHIDIGATALVQVETGGTGNAQNGVAVAVTIIDQPAYDPTDRNELVDDKLDFLEDEANTSRRALVRNTPDHVLRRTQAVPGSSDQVFQLYFGDPGVFDVLIPAFTYGSNIAPEATSEFTVTVTHVSVLNNRTLMTEYKGNLDNRQAHVPELWIPAFEFEGRGGANNEHISIAVTEQEAGGFLASTVADFSISLYDHGTIHAVGGWAYGDTDTKLPLDKLPEIPDQLPARTAATAGQVLGLASDKSLAWRDTRRAVLAYQGAIDARPRSVNSALNDMLNGWVGSGSYDDVWQSVAFQGGATWEPDDIIELRLSSALATTLPLYRVTGQGDTTIYPPSESTIYDYGHSPNPPNRRAADVVSITATTYNWWIAQTSTSIWLNGANNTGGAGNSFYPIWTPTIPERDDSEWAKITATFRINHVNPGRFYVFTQWYGQLIEHSWTDAVARPGNLHLTVILHKKN